jgi:hypothetical protein
MANIYSQVMIKELCFFIKEFAEAVLLEHMQMLLNVEPVIKIFLVVIFV